jgi:hypothetical protein
LANAAAREILAGRIAGQTVRSSLHAGRRCAAVRRLPHTKCVATGWVG